MKKYMVIVNNGKYLVKVEAESALQAEHRILDNFDGITGSQAFDYEAMKTECFRVLALDAEPVTLEGLAEICQGYASRWQEAAEAAGELARAGYSVQALERELEKAREALEEARGDQVIATLAAKAYQLEMLGIKSEA